MIPFVDEVLAGEPRYTITHADNTTEVVSIDLATPVTTQGTEMNKNYFDSIKSYIDLHGKYNEATLVQGATLHTGGYIPSMSSASGGFSVSVNGTSTRAYNPVNANAEESYQVTVPAGETRYWQINLPSEIIVRKFTVHFNASFASSAYIVIKGSKDLTNWITIATYTNGGTKTITLNNNLKVKYIRIEFANESTVSGNTTSFAIYANSVQITEWYTQSDISILNIPNSLVAYENGQRVAIQLPADFVGGYLQLNINTLEAKNVTLPYNYGIIAGKNIPLVYNGTEFVLDEVTY